MSRQYLLTKNLNFIILIRAILKLKNGEVKVGSENKKDGQALSRLFLPS